MEYKKVKTIKEPVSVLGIGCWNFGGDWDTSDERQDLDIIREAVGSSIIMNFAFLHTALAISTICWFATFRSFTKVSGENPAPIFVKVSSASLLKV